MKNIYYILQLFDSARFIVCSLPSFVNNLSEGIHIIKCKYEHDDKKCETFVNKHKYCDCFFEYKNFKGDLIEYISLCCNKICQQKFDEKLKERLFNTSFLTIITTT